MNQETGVTILIDDKTDFKVSHGGRDEEGLFILIKVGDKSSRGHYSSKYVCTEYRHGQLHKTHTTRLKVTD